MHLRISRPIVVTLCECVCVFSPTVLVALDKLNKTSIQYCFCISSISHSRCCARQPCTLVKRSVLFGPQCYQYINRQKDWLRCLSEDMKAFGIESEGGTTRARDEVEWHSCVEQGAYRFFADWCHKDDVETAKRHAKAASQELVT